MYLKKYVCTTNKKIEFFFIMSYEYKVCTFV